MDNPLIRFAIRDLFYIIQKTDSPSVKPYKAVDSGQKNLIEDTSLLDIDLRSRLDFFRIGIYHEIPSRGRSLLKLNKIAIHSWTLI